MPKTLFYPAQIKKLCQYLVQLAEVIPTSSGRSPYPPSALTRGRLAHFVHLRTSGFSQCSHTSVSHSVVLHGFLSFFPTLAQGCFPFFSLWVLDCRFWAELHFFSSCENDFLLVLWIHSPFFFKRSCITSIQQSSSPFFPQCPKRSFIAMHVSYILSLFRCLKAPIVRLCFSIFGSGVFVSIGSGLVGSLVCLLLRNYFYRTFVFVV